MKFDGPAIWAQIVGGLIKSIRIRDIVNEKNPLTLPILGRSFNFTFHKKIKFQMSILNFDISDELFHDGSNPYWSTAKLSYLQSGTLTIGMVG